MDAQIWYGLLDTERAIRYYSYLADRFAWLHKILSITMILAGSSAGRRIYCSVSACSHGSGGLFRFLSRCLAMEFELSGEVCRRNANEPAISRARYRVATIMV